jgi:uncharacterized protein YndB with AHSA1/START domain
VSQLFVDQSVQINAPASTVWRVLTEPQFTVQWVNAGWQPFLQQPAGPLGSDWQLGSAVDWPYDSGEIYVTGEVTAVEPQRLLRFTVFDTKSARPPVTEEDGITLTLSEREGGTLLAVRQGDFGKLDGGAKYQRMTNEVWQRVLPKIKELAEESTASASKQAV